MSRGRWSTLLALVAVVATVAGCSSALPQPAAEGEPVAPPAVTQVQSLSIVSAVGTVLAAADKSLDPSTLPERLTGPALAMRAAEYVRAKATNGAKAPTALPSNEASGVIPQTMTWPRSALVITQQPDDLSAQRVLVLNQAQPREQYKLWGWARIFPGTTMPATASLDTGSPVVAADDPALLVKPADVLAQYADLLANGTASASASTIASDVYQTQIAANRKLQADGVAKGGGTFSETYAPVGAPVVALATVDGGALVVGQLTVTTSVTAASGGSLSKDDPFTTALAGIAPTTSLVRTYTDVLVLYIPAASVGGKVRALAAEQILTAASAS